VDFGKFLIPGPPVAVELIDWVSVFGPHPSDCQTFSRMGNFKVIVSIEPSKLHQKTVYDIKYIGGRR